MFTSRNLFSIFVKDRLLHLVAFMRIYLFTCCYGARYIGHSLSLLSTRVRKRIPVRSHKSERNIVISSVLERLIDSNHFTDRQVNDKIYYTIHPNLLKFFLNQLLETEEALLILEMKPKLRVQKKYVLSLSST
ncbi:hypothetical protein Smp_118710 [Schistosoma mansoni]|uniref:CARD domain-containing protein n=1 Tax=Schistosoma mansoni TaxID=6183 RepID=C4QTL1_SCHMA|nr:hypothetical protein Smp_118710 [Schistosoma mansoni]|eukprot:XP_018644597.1 hypothetical protein Smp_118710 [Schistosoma mansoni]